MFDSLKGNIPTELRHTFEGDVIELLWTQLLKVLQSDIGYSYFFISSLEIICITSKKIIFFKVNKYVGQLV
jgi:hypothetical protein